MATYLPYRESGELPVRGSERPCDRQGWAGGGHDNHVTSSDRVLRDMHERDRSSSHVTGGEGPRSPRDSEVVSPPRDTGEPQGGP